MIDVTKPSDSGGEYFTLDKSYMQHNCCSRWPNCIHRPNATISGGEKEIEELAVELQKEVLSKNINVSLMTCLEIIRLGYSKTPKSNGLVKLDETELLSIVNEYLAESHNCHSLVNDIIYKFGQLTARVINMEEIKNIILEGSKKVYTDAPTLAQAIYAAIYRGENGGN